MYIIFQEEKYSPIPDYEKEYACSVNGNIISLPRNGTKKEIRFLKYKIDKYGYFRCTLYKHNKPKDYLVHRLIAMTFIHNPNNLPQINHIDGNKQNNCVDNLEWCDSYRNIRHAYSMGLNKKRYGIDNDKSKRVYQYNLDGDFIREWNSVREIQRVLGFNNSNIQACCVGRYKKSHGYKWEYANKGGDE